MCVKVRETLEKMMNIDLREYKKIIEAEVLVVMQQINSASKIFNYLYLGSEWNASNLEELHQNKSVFLIVRSFTLLSID